LGPPPPPPPPPAAGQAHCCCCPPASLAPTWTLLGLTDRATWLPGEGRSTRSCSGAAASAAGCPGCWGGRCCAGRGLCLGDSMPPPSSAPGTVMDTRTEASAPRLTLCALPALAGSDWSCSGAGARSIGITLCWLEARGAGRCSPGSPARRRLGLRAASLLHGKAHSSPAARVSHARTCCPSARAWDATWALMAWLWVTEGSNTTGCNRLALSEAFRDGNAGTAAQVKMRSICHA